MNVRGNRKDMMSKKGSRKPTNVAIHKELSKHLLLNRVRSGLTQEQCSELVGVTFQQYQKWEKGSNRIFAEQLIELCSKAKWNIETFTSPAEEVLYMYRESLRELEYSDNMLSEKIAFIRRKFQVLDDLMPSTTLAERE